MGVKVNIFESKPDKVKKYRYSIQRTGQYKSSGSGGLYPRNKFNHENPVLEAEVNGKIIKIGDNHPEVGKITRMNLSNGGLRIHRGTKSFLIDADEETATPEAPKKDYFEEFKKYALESDVELTNEDDVAFNDHEFPHCCAIEVIGGFSDRVALLDAYLDDVSENYIDEMDNGEYEENEAEIQKGINKVKKCKKDDSFWLELATAKLQNVLSSLTKSWIATLNKKEQLLWVLAFERIQDIEFETETFDKGRLIMYRHLV